MTDVNERAVAGDLATALQIVRESAMRAAGDPVLRQVACRLLDAIADAVVAGVPECAQ